MEDIAELRAYAYQGCVHKLTRAREHRDLLVTLGREWAARQTLIPIVEPQPEPRTWLLRAPILSEPPMAMGAVISDLVAQVGGTLDHIASFLVRGYGDVRKVRRAFFPVALTAEAWPAAAKKALPGVKGPVIDRLAQCQPFRGQPLVHVLKEMWNADKHHYVLPVATISTREPTISARPWDSPVIAHLETLITPGEVFASGQPVARAVTVDGWTGPPPLVMEVSIAIAAGYFTDGTAGPTTGLLHSTIDLVEALVHDLLGERGAALQ